MSTCLTLLLITSDSHKRRTTGARGSGGSGLHKTGIRGIQDTRQIVDGNTNDIENNDKKGGSRFINILEFQGPMGPLKFLPLRGTCSLGLQCFFLFSIEHNNNSFVK